MNIFKEFTTVMPGYYVNPAATAKNTIKESNDMRTEEIIALFNSKGIKVSKKEKFYNGAWYGEKYTVLGSSDIDGVTPYMGIPTKLKSVGFITKSGILQNFFYHTGNGFKTTSDINKFLKDYINCI
jgi:hypothetical protein